MDFTPSQRLQSRLAIQLNQAASAPSQPIPVFVAVKRRRGLRHYAACVFRGFYDPEVVRRQAFMWTYDQAVLECQFPTVTKLNYIWLEVGRTAPSGAAVDVFVDDQKVVQQKLIRGRSTIRIQLPEPRLATNVELGIRTTTFVPATTWSESVDNRELGIALQAVVFGKRRTKYRPGTFRRDSFHQRVALAIDRWWGSKAA